jgi:replicative DNA helicase|nr:MAG TPA: DnaB-like replicative helicase [Caudoviricetes sp.]
MADLIAAPVGRLEAENAVLGSLLLDERLAASILAAVDPADIADPANRRIFQAARALLRDGLPVDPVTIRGKLGKDSEARLVQLLEVTPTAANWREYADIMHEQAALSRIRDIAQELADAQTVDDCRGRIASLGEILAGGEGVDAWTMADAYRYFMAAQSDEHKREYISYGIREIDEGTYTEPGDVVVIGGEPSSGKTAFALKLAYHMAQRHNVGFFSLETGQAKLTDRLVSAAVGIDFDAIKRQTMGEDDWLRVAQDGESFTSRKLTLIRGSGMGVTQIQSASRSYGFDVIFVDYVQLITPEGDLRANQTQVVAAISRALHTFAQSTGTLVVELAQLSRPQEKGKWYEPGMRDLKESGQLEQDADTIMLLYKPKPDGDFDPDKTRILRIAKQKEGRLGKWPLIFDGRHQRFAVMVNPDGRSVARKLRDMGKAAAARRPRADDGQIKLEEIEETGDEPL